VNKRLTEPILWILLLMVVSALLYAGYYAVVRDVNETFLVWLGNLAFIPFELVLVTLIIDQVLRTREKRAMRMKAKMIVGAFFSELGLDLIGRISKLDIHAVENREYFDIEHDWTERDFKRAMHRLDNANYEIDPRNADREELTTLFEEKRNFLLRLIENPSILEHGPFTDLLWAVFHLAEELTYRKEVTSLPEADYEHLFDDFQRAYTLLVSEWLIYLKHLKQNYPYLFSLALRLDPFDEKASAVVQ
jgi:hypothetical protein